MKAVARSGDALTHASFDFLGSANQIAPAFNVKNVKKVVRLHDKLPVIGHPTNHLPDIARQSHDKDQPEAIKK
jgi:hypothetical protein